MNFSITSPDQIIKLDMVDAGCAKIDSALETFATSAKSVGIAKDFLGPDSLLCGDATVISELETLTNAMDKFQAVNEGVTANIRARAQAQYEEEMAEYRRYLAWLNEQEEASQRSE